MKAERVRSQQAMKATETFLIHSVLILLSIAFAIPLVWMLLTAVKPIAETMKNPPVWIPSKWEFNNFPDAIYYGADKLGFAPFIVYGINTLLLVILCVAGTVFSNSLVGYSFARLRWPGRDFCFSVVLATMMVPFPVLMVPTFGLFRQLEWVGTFRPLWIPAWFGSAFSIYLLRQFFRSIPMELSEAAKLDGCSEFGIFHRVILPLSKPALAVVALFSFIGTWNDFLGPMIYLQDQKTFTLAVGLQAYQSQHGGTPWNLLMAASSLVVAPVIIVFFLAQKQFIQGIAVTGLKG